MMELTPEQKTSLTGGGDCPLHFHASDRTVQHEQLDQLQACKVVKNVIAAYTAKYTDDIIVVDTTAGGAFNITLPLAKGGKEFTIVKPFANSNFNIVFSGGQTMWGTATINLSAALSMIVLKSVSGGYIKIG
jgi:hypothetical protein